MGQEIAFTYTAAGDIEAPREFRVTVPSTWSPPSSADSSPENMGTYTVVHTGVDGYEVTGSLEKLDTILEGTNQMGARVGFGKADILADEMITFTYQNAAAPATAETSNFQMWFGGVQVGDVSVRVQDSMPSMLSLSSAGTVSADAGAELVITVGLADADGNAVAMNSDAMVTLTSSSATGAFSMMAGEAGTASATVTIAGGDVSKMVYYTDSTAGTATITATAPGLTAASQAVTVTADPTAMPTITSVSVDPVLAMMDDTVTVSAMATAGQTAMFSVGAIVTNKAMTESAAAAGSYSGSFMVVADQHADGMYDVTVNVGTASMTREPND